MAGLSGTVSRFKRVISAAFRALIQERVKAGLRNAQSKGKRLGRPRRVVDASRLAALRASGMSWRAISRDMGIGIATLYRCCKSNC
jgi:DNA invertase Pin-like site-specific DNA recombinase